MTEKNGSTKGKARLEPGLSKQHMSEQDNQIIGEESDAEKCVSLTQRNINTHSTMFSSLAAGIAAMELEALKYEQAIEQAQIAASIEDGARAAALASAAIEKAMAGVV